MKTESPEALFHRATTEAASILVRDRADLFDGLFSGYDLVDTVEIMIDELQNILCNQDASHHSDSVKRLEMADKPVTELGQIALSYTLNVLEGHSVIRHDEHFACTSAELRFLQSIDDLEKGAFIEERRRPKAYLDDTGKLIAFKKHRGDRSLLILDETEYIPGFITGGIAELYSPWTSVSEETVLDSGNGSLDVVRLPKQTAQLVSHLRPSVFSFSIAFRDAIEYKGPGIKYTNLSFDIFGPQLQEMELEQIRERVAQLTADAIA